MFQRRKVCFIACSQTRFDPRVGYTYNITFIFTPESLFHDNTCNFFSVCPYPYPNSILIFLGILFLNGN